MLLWLPGIWLFVVGWWVATSVFVGVVGNVVLGLDGGLWFSCLFWFCVGLV